jgi:hypothetical protein
MTTFVDAETGELVDLEHVATMIELWQTTGTPRVRRRLFEDLLSHGTQLAPFHDELLRRLERGIEILGGLGRVRSDPEPQKEALWLEWLVTYEQVCDLLSAIGDGMLCGHWDRVSTRKAA